MLDDLGHLAETLRVSWINLKPPDVRGEMYCPSCGDNRRMVVEMKFENHGGHNPFHDVPNGSWSTLNAMQEKAIVPILLRLECVQCDAAFTSLLYSDPDGIRLATFPERHGSLATPHTPPAVAYYLDQVQRCWSVGANSAAIGMYRVALDHLLFGEDFKDGMVGNKLAALETAITDGLAPNWAKDMNPRYLEVLNKLATYALHPNDGNVTQQSVFDHDLLTAVKATFQALLFRVYELPDQEKGQLITLESALRKLQS